MWFSHSIFKINAKDLLSRFQSNSNPVEASLSIVWHWVIPVSLCFNVLGKIYFGDLLEIQVPHPYCPRWVWPHGQQVFFYWLSPIRLYRALTWSRPMSKLDYTHIVNYMAHRPPSLEKNACSYRCDNAKTAVKTDLKSRQLAHPTEKGRERFKCCWVT